jgi:hypothetical protein
VSKEVEMIPLMLSLLVDTVAVDPYYDTVRDHEWGVIQMDYGFYEAVGAEWCYPDENGNYRYGEMMIVDAPVVWFHGPGFSGSFAVDVMKGSFTTVYPEPDVIEQIPPVLESLLPTERATWSGLEFTRSGLDDERVVDRISSMGCEMENFAWAAPWWREVPSLAVSRESDGWSDRFIYYECTTASLHPDGEAIRGNISDICRGPGLLFSYSQAECTFMVEKVMIEDVLANPRSYPQGNDDWQVTDIVTAELCRWAESNMKSEELEALWKTWKPVILDRCDMFDENILLFPLTDEVVESISRLTLTTDEGFFVEYHRLFLGLIALR